jgi:hypothetical protein
MQNRQDMTVFLKFRRYSFSFFSPAFRAARLYPVFSAGRRPAREKSGIALSESRILPPTACTSSAIQRNFVLKIPPLAAPNFISGNFYMLKILHPYVEK